ncbi:hypothetical protein PRK78_005703 [Emydomyces testavorans]|uniref:FHA domain-containing protein n=1 Tax=Emydomyces testavorans TaxID=2070801 RepID=A0AAF0DL81_9EURO|nr:hypothetical protein PRK78_005703 [Emydomyces testavorans]
MLESFSGGCESIKETAVILRVSTDALLFVVTLTIRGIDGTGPFPERVITLNAGTYRISLGRASKVQTKNLIPNKDNLWFDNPVLSRNHAEFVIVPGQEEVYLTDTKSMHGTWVNFIKLSSGKKVLLDDGDVVIFGARISRGKDMFAPLRGRVFLSWDKEINTTTEKVSISPSQPTNTFTVPDDDHESDSDVIEVQCGPNNKYPWALSNSASDVASSVSSANEDDAESPVTSPVHPVETCSLKNQKSPDAHARSERDDSVLFVPHDMVSDPNTDFGEANDENSEVAMPVGDVMSDALYKSESESVTSEDHGLLPLEEEEQDAKHDEIPDTQNSNTGDRAVTANANCTNQLGEGALPSTPESMQRDGQPTAALPDYENASSKSASEESELTNAYPRLTSEEQISQLANRSSEELPTRHGLNTTSITTQQVLTNNTTNNKMETVVMPNHSLASLLRTVDSGINGWSSWPANMSTDPQRHGSSKSPYTEGPFAGENPVNIPINTPFVNRTGPSPEYTDHWRSASYSAKPENSQSVLELAGSNKPMMRETCRCSHRQTRPWSGQHIRSKENTCHLDSENSAIKLEGLKGHTTSGGLEGKLKRKFDETEIPTTQSTDMNGNSDIFPDAQPRDIIVPETIRPDSLLVETAPTSSKRLEKASIASEMERPAKRVKTVNKQPSRMRSVARYAATAVAGAVVGSIGAVAVLASLPPDYFN